MEVQVEHILSCGGIIALAHLDSICQNAFLTATEVRLIAAIKGASKPLGDLKILVTWFFGITRTCPRLAGFW